MATAASASRIEAFAVPGGLKGSLSQLPLPDILQHLAQTHATGILSLVAGGARKAVYLMEGRVVFASSNLPNDRLGEILIREGKITVEEYENSIRCISKGKRQGRILVEMGALSPKDLWEGVQFQIHEIIYSVFQWDDGTFHFEESNLPAKERITVDLDIVDLILAGVRRIDASGVIQTRYPGLDIVLEATLGDRQPPFEPYEQHVLAAIDGERSVFEICRESEIGDSETLKTLYAFIAAGIVRLKGKKVRPLDQDFVQGDDFWSVLESFNQMYSYIFRYMVREVGPIAENVLEKYLATLRQGRREVFAEVKLLKDGTLDGVFVERNISQLPELSRRGTLVDALNEFLYAELLAVKRTLGPDHESAIIRALHDR